MKGLSAMKRYVNCAETTRKRLLDSLLVPGGYWMLLVGVFVGVLSYLLRPEFSSRLANRNPPPPRTLGLVSNLAVTIPPSLRHTKSGDERKTSWQGRNGELDDQACHSTGFHFLKVLTLRVGVPTSIHDAGGGVAACLSSGTPVFPCHVPQSAPACKPPDNRSK